MTSAYAGKTIAAAITGLLLLIVGCKQSNLPQIAFSTASGDVAKLAVEVDATDQARQHGLMGVKSFPESQGQLFLFQDISPNQDVQVSFWMKDTPLALSIAFVSADGHVQEIQDMLPESTDLHTPQSPYRYAIEAHQGWFTHNRVAIGSTVDLSAALAAARR